MFGVWCCWGPLGPAGTGVGERIELEGKGEAEKLTKRLSS